MPDEVARMRRALGQELARLRNATGLTQRQFAPLTTYSRSTLSDAELGRGRISRDFWERCQAILQAGDLTSRYDEIATVAAAYRAAATRARARGQIPSPPVPSRVTVQVCPRCHQPVEVVLLPPGR